MIQIPRSQYVQKPWKNGGGVTEEIYLYSKGSTEFLYRLSMASLSQSGPFSLFPEIDRTLVLLEGNPIKLNEREVPLLTAVHFPGEDLIHSTITAAGLDFNLMCRRGKVSGMIALEVGAKVLNSEADHTIIFSLDEGLTLGQLVLSKYDSCVIDHNFKDLRVGGGKYLRVSLSFV